MKVLEERSPVDAAGVCASLRSGSDRKTRLGMLLRLQDGLDDVCADSEEAATIAQQLIENFHAEDDSAHGSMMQAQCLISLTETAGFAGRDFSLRVVVPFLLSQTSSEMDDTVSTTLYSCLEELEVSFPGVTWSGFPDVCAAAVGGGIESSHFRATSACCCVAVTMAHMVGSQTSTVEEAEVSGNVDLPTYCLRLLASADTMVPMAKVRVLCCLSRVSIADPSVLPPQMLALHVRGLWNSLSYSLVHVGGMFMEQSPREGDDDSLRLSWASRLNPAISEPSAPLLLRALATCWAAASLPEGHLLEVVRPRVFDNFECVCLKMRCLAKYRVSSRMAKAARQFLCVFDEISATSGESRLLSEALLLCLHFMHRLPRPSAASIASWIVERLDCAPNLIEISAELLVYVPPSGDLQNANETISKVCGARPKVSASDEMSGGRDQNSMLGVVLEEQGVMGERRYSPGFCPSLQLGPVPPCDGVMETGVLDALAETVIMTCGSMGFETSFNSAWHPFLLRLLLSGRLMPSDVKGCVHGLVKKSYEAEALWMVANSMEVHACEWHLHAGAIKEQTCEVTAGDDRDVCSEHPGGGSEDMERENLGDFQHRKCACTQDFYIDVSNGHPQRDCVKVLMPDVEGVPADLILERVRVAISSVCARAKVTALVQLQVHDDETPPESNEGAVAVVGLTCSLRVPAGIATPAPFTIPYLRGGGEPGEAVYDLALDSPVLMDAEIAYEGVCTCGEVIEGVALTTSEPFSVGGSNCIVPLAPEWVASSVEPQLWLLLRDLWVVCGGESTGWTGSAGTRPAEDVAEGWYSCVVRGGSACDFDVVQSICGKMMAVSPENEDEVLGMALVLPSNILLLQYIRTENFKVLRASTDSLQAVPLLDNLIERHSRPIRHTGVLVRTE